MPLVSLAVTDGVALLTLDDPQRRNALSFDLCDELHAAFDRIEADDDIHAVVLTGTGRAFSAGADLSQLGTSRKEGLERIYGGFLRLARCPKPTVAAVNGAAVGAGMNLALAADVRIVAASAKFDCRFVDLGIHPGGGHTWMLRRIVGPQAAHAMVVFGQILDGAEAERVGLAWRCVPDDDLLSEALALAGRAASGPPELVRKVKASIQRMADVAEHDDAVAVELEPQLWSMDQPAFADRLAAIQNRISGKA